MAMRQQTGLSKSKVAPMILNKEHHYLLYNFFLQQHFSTTRVVNSPKGHLLLLSWSLLITHSLRRCVSATQYDFLPWLLITHSICLSQTVPEKVPPPYTARLPHVPPQSFSLQHPAFFTLTMFTKKKKNIFTLDLCLLYLQACSYGAYTCNG